MVSAIPPRPLRLRSPGHLAFVRTLRCTICGHQPSDPHHLKHAQLRAKSRKSGDQWTVPLCRRHHDAVETAGDEALWWRGQDIDPAVLATELWAISRASDGKGPRCPF
jgi:hypothetical protein